MNFEVDAFSLNRRKLPMLLQDEAAECGLVCLIMILNYHGYQMDLISARQRHQISLSGSSLKDIVDIASFYKLGTRAVRIELGAVAELELPSILHWDLNHFVVLKSVHKHHVILHDPASGVMKMKWEEFSKHFTGIALELLPLDTFEKKIEKKSVSIKSLVGSLGQFKPLFLQVLGLSILLQLFAIVMPMYGQIVLDEVVVSQDYSLLKVLALGFTLLLFFQIALSVLQSIISIYLTSRYGIKIGLTVFNHLIFLPLTYFKNRHIGDVVSKFESASVLTSFILQDSIKLLLSALFLLVTLFMMLVYSLGNALIVIFFTLAYVALRTVLYHRDLEIQANTISDRAKEDSNFMESVRGIQSIKLFNKESDRQERWLKHHVKVLNHTVKNQKLDIVFNSVQQLASGLENILIYFFGAISIMNGSLSVGMFVAFLAYRGQFADAAITLINGFFEFRMLSVHKQRLADIVMTKNEVVDFSPNFSLPEKFDIRVKNLGFRYSDSEPFVFRHVNLEIKHGEHMVIVGPSGSGKSTLLKVILGLYPASEGEIFVNNIPVADIGITEYRQLFATVMQDDSLFSGSISENIAMFSEQIDYERVAHCAALACISEDIERMTMGYQSLVGDMGTTLSGGQNQRVLLARAYYKAPRVLVVDEATSHLDKITEFEVMTNIQKMDITILSIAHNPGALDVADKIFCLEPYEEGD